MNKTAQNRKKARHTKLPSESYKKCQNNQISFTVSLLCTCKILSSYDVWFKFYDKLCSPYPIVDFLLIFNHQNQEP